MEIGTVDLIFEKETVIFYRLAKKIDKDIILKKANVYAKQRGRNNAMLHIRVLSRLHCAILRARSFTGISSFPIK